MFRTNFAAVWMVTVAAVVLATAGPAAAQEKDQAWLRLFDGESLKGWRASEHKDTFSVRDGAIVAHGERSHLFYEGPVQAADFTDFELKVDVKTEPSSNGGIFFHTAYQETGWPKRGFEVQVNNTYARDPRKTASLYGVRDVSVAPAKDHVWFTVHIIVQGKRVVAKVDGNPLVDWTAPQESRRSPSSGTFALQGHDPGSTVHYRNIYVKPLPPLDFPVVDYHVHLKGGLTLAEAIAEAQRRGVQFGIAQNCGVGFPVTDDKAALGFLGKMKGKGVVIGMQAEGREWVEMFSPEVIAQFDYVFTDSMTFSNRDGKRMRLWIPNEVIIGDKQEFMELLVEKAVGILSNEPIDIYVNPTYLPGVIADEYDQLWTEERMDRVIAAAVANDVAIEINSRFRLPSETFIRRAKAAGAKFSFGTNNGGRDLDQLAYSRLMARRCGLTAEDMFVLKPHGRKPVQVRGLPR